MKEISLTQGKVAMVDDEDYEHLMQWKWRVKADKKRDVIYAVRSNYWKKEGEPPNVRMHRQIAQIKNPKIQVDHIDGNGLNNQKSNLRTANNSENNCNRGPQKNGTSKYKGVSWKPTHNRWLAQIVFLGKHKRIGAFIEEKDAALAYNKAAKELHGEFAYLNKIE